MDELTNIEWTGIALSLLGSAILLAGIWIKAGPELAMIAGGLLFISLGTFIFRNSAS